MYETIDGMLGAGEKISPKIEQQSEKQTKKSDGTATQAIK